MGSPTDFRPAILQRSSLGGANTAFRRQIDVEERGSVDKAQVISALQSSGEADYDSVSYLRTGD